MEGKMKDIKGIEKHHPESIFLGYLIGKKDSSIKAQEILASKFYREKLGINGKKAKKDLHNRMEKLFIIIDNLKE